MSGTQEMLQIEPLELRFPFELHKEIKCSLHLVNKTNEYVAFKVRSTSPKKYRVMPNYGFMQPGSDFNIVVTMQARTEAPADMNCKDKFQVQSVIATESTIVNNINDVTNIMKGPAKVVQEVISVAYVQSDPEWNIAHGPTHGRNNANAKFQEAKSEETVKRSMLQVHFEKPETIQEEEEEGEEKEEEAIPVSTQNANEFEALFHAEVQKREKIEKELERVRKESEDRNKLVKELQKKMCCIEFKFEELHKATDDFAESNKIGEGAFGAVYKGVLHHTQVAIKKLKIERGFNEEIETLSKVRHPNLVTLIGACRDNETLALVYEYLPQGSLEDHLNCKNNTPPLSGQTRIRIALEICSALCFLHSTLRSHGDLKPDNILLDSNYVSKLSDFGTCRQLTPTKGTITPSHQTANVTGTYAYMDPEYLSSGVMTPRFDVYSFGIVLLRLATGKDVRVVFETSAMGIIEAVETAIEDKTFDKLVDASIEWPSNEVPKKMAELGLDCFKFKRRRPNASKLFESLKNIASNQ